MKIQRDQAFFALLALIGLPAAVAYGYQPPAQVVITDAEKQIAAFAVTYARQGAPFT